MEDPNMGVIEAAYVHIFRGSKGLCVLLRVRRFFELVGFKPRRSGLPAVLSVPSMRKICEREQKQSESECEYIFVFY